MDYYVYYPAKLGFNLMSTSNDTFLPAKYLIGMFYILIFICVDTMPPYVNTIIYINMGAYCYKHIVSLPFQVILIIPAWSIGK